MTPSTLSIIIPTYNRAALLEKTLVYFAAQTAGERCEIVIADDGSSDDTARVVRSFQSMLRIVHCWQERAPGAQWNAARPRNHGLASASGQVVTFLDCGMVVAPDFALAVLARTTDPRRVLLHPLLGTGARQEDLARLPPLTPASLPEVLQKCRNSNTWRDRRDSLFLHVDDELDLLPAPWTLGWSGAFTVHAGLARQVGGFDASFDGWGAEDQDFAYRLRRAGASFGVIREAPALHLPHETVSHEDHSATLLVNRRKVHRRHYDFDTELYPLYPGRYYNQVLARWKSFIPGDVLPLYGDGLARRVGQLIRSAQRSLLVGSDQAGFIELLEPSDMFVTNEGTCRALGRSSVSRQVHQLIGCDTPFAEDTFDVAVVTDFVRVLAGRVLEAFLKEMCRIARRILVLTTPRFSSPLQTLDGMAWTPTEQVADTARRAGADWSKAEDFEGHELFWVTRRGPGDGRAH